MSPVAARVAAPNHFLGPTSASSFVKKSITVGEASLTCVLALPFRIASRCSARQDAPRWLWFAFGGGGTASATVIARRERRAGERTGRAGVTVCTLAFERDAVRMRAPRAGRASGAVCGDAAVRRAKRDDSIRCDYKRRNQGSRNSATMGKTL